MCSVGYCCVHKNTLINAVNVKQKVVGMSNVDSVAVDRSARKVILIKCDDDACLSHNGCSEDVTVIFVGKLKRRDQLLIARNQAVWRCVIHRMSSGFQVG